MSTHGLEKCPHWLAWRDAAHDARRKANTAANYAQKHYIDDPEARDKAVRAALLEETDTLQTALGVYRRAKTVSGHSATTH